MRLLALLNGLCTKANGRRAFAMVVASMLFWTLAGCSGPNKPSWSSLNPSTWSNKRHTDEPIVLDVAGAISVDVETFEGGVTITADPKATAASVTVVREAVHGWGRSGEAKASLADIKVSAELGAADMTRGELGQTLRVRVTSDNAEPHLQRGHVYVVAPQIEGVTVRSDDGHVDITHVEGAVDIEASRGNIRVATSLPMRHPVTIINRDGHIDYRVRGESSGVFDAQTVNGRVSAEVRFGSLFLKGTSRHDLYQATLNDGTNPIILRTTNGNIRIAVVADPEGVVLWRSGPNKPPKENEDSSGAVTQPAEG